MIYNLQLLRAIAAIGVVFYHTDYRLAGDLHTDFSGVAIFFVISGFIMCHITRENATGFLIKRAIRIVPLYWVCTFLLLIIGYRFSLLNLSTYTNTTLAGDIPRSLLFLPWPDRTPILGVGWTLNFEIYFYLVFALALAINVRFAPLITGVIVWGVTKIDEILGGAVFLIHYYSHPYISYFVAGIAVYYVWVLFPRHLVGRPLAAICFLFIAFLLNFPFASPLLPTWLMEWLFLMPAIVVGCALLAETSGFAIKWRPLLLLGDASYSIYLTHTILFEVFRFGVIRLKFPMPKESFAVMAFYLISAIVIGVIAHLYLEKPILHWIRAKLHTGPSVPKEIGFKRS